MRQCRKQIRREKMKRFFWIGCLCAGLCVLKVDAQYFGRNKVQYETFDFKVLETDNLKVHYYQREQKAAKDAARMLERWYTRLRQVFDRSLPDDQPVILYASHADFQQTNAIGGLISQSTGGVTEGYMNRVVIPLTGVYSQDNHVLGHELVHAFHYEMIKSGEGGLARSAEIPLWFIEGMAEYLSLGGRSSLTSMWMRDAVLHGDIPSFADLDTDYRYFPYRFGHSVWAYLGSRYGDRCAYTLFRGVLRHGWLPGFRRSLGSTADSVSLRWGKMLEKHYGPTLEGRTLPNETGEEVVSQGQMNLAPSISPDGTRMAFLSTRDIFTIDLFLADARTGRVIHKLASSQGDEHFDALRFSNSSGSWSPDGEQFAFVVFREGRNEIAIADVSSAEVGKPLRPDGINEITGLAWSPDGRRLAVSGSYGGRNDLFLYDLSRDSTWKLTDDRYAELQPVWSPDGSRIAFVTDRGADTDLDSLSFGPMKLGIYSLSGDTVELVSIASWAKHINPQFSSDGKSLYMVADPDGVSDIYKYSLETGEVSRITKIATGISGLSDLSPVMSVASTGQMVFSVFSKGEYSIRGLQPSDMDPQPFTPDYEEYERVVSLCSDTSSKVTMIVDPYLDSSENGLPDTNKFSVNNYTPRLKLLYVGQLYAGVAADRYGVGVGGGASFLFSDLLGDHLLGLAAQINGSLEDVGAQGLYLNKRGRVNWGLSMGRVPHYSSSLEARSGGDSTLYTLVEERVFENSVSGFFDFPLSTNRRFEFGAGYTRYSYDYQGELITVRNGVIEDRDPTPVENPSSMDLFQASAAYVGDYSFFGFTAPVSGRRYRLEVEQTLGTVNYVSALMDYRHYLFRNPLTFALRFFHYGRYLGDSESDRLTPLFLGYENWVRGYSAYSYDLSPCRGEDDYSECPEFNRLLGSRLGIVNMELRLPVLGTEQFGLFNFPYLPTDLVAFLDGGVAWTAADYPELKWDRTNTTDRIPVFSAGAAARFNFFGLLVMQLYYAYPFQRPGYGWNWGFLISPGW